MITTSPAAQHIDETIDVNEKENVKQDWLPVILSGTRYNTLIIPREGLLLSSVSPLVETINTCRSVQVGAAKPGNYTSSGHSH